MRFEMIAMSDSRVSQKASHECGPMDDDWFYWPDVVNE